VCVCVKERERERERVHRDRVRDTVRNRSREIHRDKEIDDR
jgi:hypothetical protein